jgi:hypothetical protein
MTARTVVQEPTSKLRSSHASGRTWRQRLRWLAQPRKAASALRSATMKPLVLALRAKTETRERGMAFAWVERVARSPRRSEPESNDPALERRFGVISE